MNFDLFDLNIVVKYKKKSFDICYDQSLNFIGLKTGKNR
jgi:hypothetical protein